jgi:hypothetical protein
MGSAGTTPTFDQLLATTLDEHGRDAFDNIFNGIPLVKHLMMNGRIKWDGSGATYRVPVKYATSTASGWTSGFKKVNTTPQNFIGEAVYQMKKAYASVTYSFDETDQNRGTNALLNIVDEKIQQAKDTIMDNIATALFATSVATDTMNSLVTTVDSTGTVGGIDQSSYSWWAGYENSSVGSFAAGGLSAMDTAWNTVSKGKTSGQPTIVVTSQTIFQYLQNALRAHGMDYYAKKRDLGVPEVMYNGVSVIWDAKCPSGTMFMLNARSLGLAVDGTKNLKTTEFVKPADQLAKTGQIYTRIQLICGERRAQAKLSGITA